MKPIFCCVLLSFFSTLAGQEAVFERAKRAEESLKEQADSAWRNGDLERAAALLTRALEKEPEWEEGLWLLGSFHFASEEFETARAHFRRFLLRQPFHGPALAMIGLCEFGLRNYEKAVADLQKGRELGLGQDRVLGTSIQFHLALLLNRFEKHDRAFQLLEALASESLDERLYATALGLALLREPYLPEEIPLSRMEEVQIAGEAGYAMVLRQAAQADRKFRQLATKYGHSKNVHLAYATFLMTEDPERAERHLLLELETAPRNFAALVRLSLEYERRGESEKAFQTALRAVESRPDDFSTRYALGRSLLAMGRLQEAVSELKISAALEPTAPGVRYALSNAFRRLGRHEDAEREKSEFFRLQSQHENMGMSPAGRHSAEPSEGRPR